MKDLDEGTLLKMAAGQWVPPIKKLPNLIDYNDLFEHHEKETKLLMEVIQELARRLVRLD